MTERYDGDRRFRPLPKSKIGTFDKVAQEMDNELTRLTGRTLLHMGMRNGCYHHSRGHWVTDEEIEGKPVIRVPPTESCIGGAGESGEGNSDAEDMHQRGVPCYACREQRDGYWTPKTKSGARPIPVMEEDVYDEFVRWFEHNDQIPLVHQSVNKRLAKIAEAAGFERRVVAHDLRHTYGTMLARMGFDPQAIASVMGHATVDMPMKYITFTGNDLVRDFKDKWDFDEYREDDGKNA